MWKLKSLRDNLKFQVGIDTTAEVEMHAGMLVGTTLFPKMEIYGFIPVCIADDMNQCLLSDVFIGYEAIGTDKIVYRDLTNCKSNARVAFPIFRRIMRRKKSFKVPLNKIYLAQYIHNPLYKACRSKLRAAEFDRRLLELSEQIVEQEGEKDLFYETNVSEFLFYRYRAISSNDLPAACADDFRVICMARNDITGNVDFRVFSPDDLILVCDEIGTIPDNR